MTSTALTEELSRLAARPRVPARVLVVDDDESARRTARAMLRGSDNEVRFAASAEVARTVARAWQPDVILLDVMMPGTDGFELCRWLRTDPATADVRVILVTALADERSRLEGFEAGADEFLTKPVRRAEILTRISGVARVNRYRRLLERQRELAHLALRVPVDPALPAGLTDAELGGLLDRAIGAMGIALQPIVEIDPSGDSRIHAQEVLLRTSDPVLSGPAAVLAAATRLGRMLEVGQAVRSQAAALLGAGAVPGPLFVNVSQSELTEGILERPDEPLRDLGHQVVFEVTEHEGLGAAGDVRRRVGALRALGFRFAVDDLGSGYSGLNNIAVLEPEYAKIDRGLVTGLATAPVRSAIIGAVGELCAELGLDLIAEGVETPADRDGVLALGCRLQQGWLHGRPSDPPGAAP